MTYRTEIKVWSRTGNTPITKRSGAYCDLLVSAVVYCETPEQAEVETVRLIRETEYGDCGHFYMPEFPNQNTRSKWL